MNLPTRILVPTDFSAPARRALDYAVDLARATGGSLLLLHAYELPFVGVPGLSPLGPVEIATRIVDASKASLQTLADEVTARGVPVTTILREAPAEDAINAVAESEAVDLIVIGTHGRGGLPRLLLGSVAEYVIRSATKPVLSITSNHADARARPPEAKAAAGR